MPDQTTLSTTYVVNSTQNFVRISLIIGGAEQTGESTIRLEDSEMLTDYKGDLYDFVIDRNQDLGGKTLYVISTISDTNNDPSNNHTELTVRLKGGVIFREYPLSKVVAENGYATYICEINFYNF